MVADGGLANTGVSRRIKAPLLLGSRHHDCDWSLCSIRLLPWLTPGSDVVGGGAYGATEDAKEFGALAPGWAHAQGGAGQVVYRGWSG